MEATNNFSSYWESRHPTSPALQTLKQGDDPYVGFSIDSGGSNTYFSLWGPVLRQCCRATSLLLTTASEFLFSAVYVVARALHKMRQNVIPLGDGTALQDAISTISFQGVSGHIAFDAQLDPVELGLLPCYPFI